MKKIVLFSLLLCCLTQAKAQVCLHTPQSYNVGTSGTTPQSVRNADFDNNGIPDIIAVNCTSIVAGITVFMNYNPSTMTFSVSNYTLASGINQTDLAVADFDGDGKQDIAIANNGATTVSFMQGNGDGTFGTAQNITMPAGVAPKAFAVANFGGDTKPDLAVINSTNTNLYTLINVSTTGTFSFTASAAISGIGVAPSAIATADFDGTNGPDIVVVSSTSNLVYTFKNNGLGTAFTSGSVAGGTGAMDVTTGDFDGVNGIDFATANNGSGNVSVFLNTGTTFTTAVNYTVSTSEPPVAITTGDFNKDGKLDLGVAGFQSVGNMYILLGTGTGTYGSPTTFTASLGNNYGGLTRLISGDYNLDGVTDMVVSQPDYSSVSMYVNAKPIISGASSICLGAATTLTANGASTYSWSATAGSVTTNSVTLTPTITTTYSVIGTSGSCSASAVQTVTVNTAPILNGIATPSSICPAATSTLNISGSGTYTWTPGSMTGPTVVVSPTVNTIYTVTATSSVGCISTKTLQVAILPTPTVSAVATSSVICKGDSTILTGGGANTYTWSTGVTTTTTNVIPVTTTIYTLTGANTSNCKNTTTVSVTVNMPDNLSGTVYDTTTVSGTHTITNGVVYIYKQRSNSTTIDTAGLLANGTFATISGGLYSFSQMPLGNYYLKAVADTNLYKGSIPTYLSTKPNAYRWDSATVIMHTGCNNGNDAGHNITIIELPALTGTGIISGTITADTSFGSGQRLSSGGYNQTMGAPLKGIDVKLGRNPGGSCAARTTAGVNGAYQFTGVGVGSYFIYVDIPNFGMVTILTATITSANPQSTNNNYCLDSININVCASATGIKQLSGNNYQVSVYPNPTNGMVNLQMNDYENARVEIYSVIGQKVYTQQMQNNLQQLNLNLVADGVYQIRVFKNNNSVFQTKIIKQ